MNDALIIKAILTGLRDVWGAGLRLGYGQMLLTWLDFQEGVVAVAAARYFSTRMTAVAPVQHSTVPRELQFKVLVIGEFGVGKYISWNVPVSRCSEEKDRFSQQPPITCLSFWCCSRSGIFWTLVDHVWVKQVLWWLCTSCDIQWPVHESRLVISMYKHLDALYSYVRDAFLFRGRLLWLSFSINHSFKDSTWAVFGQYYLYPFLMELYVIFRKINDFFLFIYHVKTKMWNIDQNQKNIFKSFEWVVTIENVSIIE